MSTETLRLLEPENPTRPYILVDLDSTIFGILPLLAAAIYERYGLDILKISASEKRSYWFPDWPGFKRLAQFRLSDWGGNPPF